MSLEAVRVKEEPEWENSAGECGVCEAAARAGLYAGHQVKDELVVGPERLQPPDVAYSLSVSVHVEAVKSEYKSVLRECSVRLERLVCDVTSYTRTKAHDECSVSVCDQNIRDKQHTADKSCVMPSAEAFAEQPLLRNCYVRLSRLPGHSPRPTSPARHQSRAESYQCDTCGKTFVYKRRLIKHIQQHSQDRSSFSKRSKINYQKEVKKTFICDKCGKHFSALAALNVHFRIHTGGKPFTCSFCKRSFTRSDHLKNHIRMHADEKSYACETCGKKFARADYLRKHKLVHKEKRFICEICGKQFMKISDVSRHKICHDIAKRYACDVCQKQFARAEHFKRHKKIHSDVKKFSCDICQKRFRELHHLMRHKKIHTGDKSHVCQICKRVFSGVGNLNTNAYRY